MYSHLHLSGDRSVGEVVAPDGRCTPILLVLSLSQVVLRGTCVVYEDGCGKDSMSGSFSVSYMEQVVGMICPGRRGGEMRDGGYTLCLILRIGEYGRVCRTGAGLM